MCYLLSSSTWSRFSIVLILLLASMPTQSSSIFSIIGTQRQVVRNIVNEPSSKPYDFIVVGAGSGGSVVANRLSENGKWRVLLLEAGGTEGTFSQVPMLVSFFEHNEDNNWGYRVQPQSRACLGMLDHRCPWPTGKSLGGTSTINYMIYTRGSRLNYDIWAALGNEGWSYKDVLPYFKKSERFKVPDVVNSSYHGSKGYLHVEHVPYHTELSTMFLRAGEQLGYKVVDYNGKDQIGFSYIQVSMDHGKRCSAATAYLTVRRSNLHILTNAHVTKVLIKEKKAYGVEYLRNGRTYTVQATKEVILSAGTVNTAQLLMLSGIGPRDHLEEMGIDVVKDSKVGYNMYEHVGFLGLVFTVNQTVSLMPSRLLRPGVIFDYALRNEGPMTIPGGPEALAFMRTDSAPDSRPDLELLFINGALHSDGGLSLKAAHGLTDEIYNAVFRPIEGKDAWSVWPVLQDPRSIGRLTLKSKNPLQAPIIQPNFFEYSADLEIILEGVKRTIEISKSGPFAAYGSQVYTPKIPGCGKFELGSDDYWRCSIRHLPAMMNHEVGTAKMGPANDPNAVVDPQLRVYGIESLRVADASIMPTIPTGHTNGIVFMIGEKAADMIKMTWSGKEK